MMVCEPAATDTSLGIGAIDIGAVGNNSAKRVERGVHKGVGAFGFRVVHSHVLLATAANRRLSCPAIRATSCAAFK